MKVFIQLPFVLCIVYSLVSEIATQKNLAPEGTTSQSTYYSIHCSPDSAVKGNASHAWISSLCTCTHTNINQRTAWWRDDFSGDVYVTNLTMYYRENYGKDLYGFEFYVTNSSSIPPPVKDRCYKDSGTSTNYPDIYQEIHCNTMGRSVVFYQSRPSPAPARAFTFICYLEINGCWKSSWGPTCNRTCPVNCINQHCYIENGTCVWGCNPTNCVNDNCNQITSVCTEGCKSGWRGQYCNKPCDDGYFGRNCTKDCHCTVSCDKANGYCSGECQAGWTGRTCNEECRHGYYSNNCSKECSIGCVEGACDRFNGRCTKTDKLLCESGWKYTPMCNEPCDDGFFGRNCTKDCHCTVTCDKANGYCSGECQAGWTGRTCNEECRHGYYSNNCSKECSIGCVEGACDRFNGRCTKTDKILCESGWKYTPMCNEQCSSGYYSNNCSKECSTGCVEGACDRFNGRCTKTDTLLCESGWKYTPMCNERCDDGFFGRNCTKDCHCTLSCKKDTGYCSGECQAGWTGRSCNEVFVPPSDGTSVGAVVGGIAGALVAVLLVGFAVIVILRKRRSEKERTQSPRYTDPTVELSKKADKIYENELLNHPSASKDYDDDDEKPVSLDGVRFAKQSGKDFEAEGNIYNNVDCEHFSEYKIPVKNLEMIINEKKNENRFLNEYKILPKGLLYLHGEASKEENKDKNRYLTTWPYDHSRVVLKGQTAHDYINASYLGSYSKEKAYIASQGPKKNTVRDFWHMVWQEKVGKIVMVTKLVEERKKKCDQYWPETVKRTMIEENFKITMQIEKEHTVFVYRRILLENTRTVEKGRTIHHFHFTQWPDHGVADKIKLISFYRKVKTEDTDLCGPMVVHCSAGIGRTGTFVAIDALHENGLKTGYVNIMEYVRMMRKDRMNMIQTEEQYALIFESLQEVFSVPDTSIPVADFSTYIREEMEQIVQPEFQRLLDLRPSYDPEKFSAAKTKANKGKNAVKNILPHNEFRPYLMTYGKTSTDYINAVIIPGHLASCWFLVTQCPLSETVADFWTMVYDHDVKTIVLLDLMNEV